MLRRAHLPLAATTAHAAVMLACTARRPGRQRGGGAARGCRLHVLFYIAGCVRGALHSKGACQHGAGAGAAQCCAAKLAQLRTREPQTHGRHTCALRASFRRRASPVGVRPGCKSCKECKEVQRPGSAAPSVPA
jgi:hypothetical protein